MDIVEQLTPKYPCTPQDKRLQTTTAQEGVSAATLKVILMRNLREDRQVGRSMLDRIYRSEGGRTATRFQLSIACPTCQAHSKFLTRHEDKPKVKHAIQWIAPTMPLIISSPLTVFTA